MDGQDRRGRGTEQPKASPTPAGCAGRVLVIALVSVCVLIVVGYYGWKLFVYAFLAAMFSQG